MSEDLTPPDNKEYATKQYWDQRYEKYVHHSVGHLFFFLLFYHD